MKKMLILAALMGACFASQAATISQADCNFAIEKLKQFNAADNANPGQRTSFEEKATYAYAEVCEGAGLVTIYGYLREAPEASPEVTKYCSDNARSRGEAERCLATGKLDDYETPHSVSGSTKPTARAKATAPVDDLLGDLSAGRNAPKAGKTAQDKPAIDVSGYAQQVRAAISSRLMDVSKYAGKRCALRISIDSKGMLLTASSEGGDPELCAAAIAATKSARLPAPPNEATYQAFKNFNLNFAL